MWRVWIGLILVFSAGAPLGAQSSQVQDVLGWHTVRDGETLQRITQRYLGTPHLWRENLKLNPQLRDPAKLRIGQRLRVIIERQLPARSALIEEVANDVHKNLQRSGWQDADGGDALAPLDGVRTRERASARLGFDDGSKLTLTELSQVFLKDLETTVRGVKRGSIEIRQGQADLLLNAPRPRRVEIEIVVGDSVTRPRPGPSGTAQTRSRRGAEGGAQLMVYGGSSRIEAAGAAVEVPRGMGTNVPEGGPPAPPEKLLPATVTTSPARGQRLSYANPRFAWRAISGAASYRVEVCSDPDCARLVTRVSGLSELTWQAERLPLGDFFWRVTVVSPSGLDGYPSKAVAFSISSVRRDLEPPVVVAGLVGPGHVIGDGALVVGRGATVELAGSDDAAGVREVRYRWDDNPWRVWEGEKLTPPAGAREHLLELAATDHLGRESRIWQVLIRRDEVAPEPPKVHRLKGPSVSAQEPH